MDKGDHQQKHQMFIPMTSVQSRSGTDVTKDVYFYTDQIVNIVFIGDKEESKWVLVDTGLPYAAKEILSIAKRRFGKGSRPEAIILTHGHFDHVGGLIDLVNEWNVPVYAHELELPYITGQKSYPEPDPTVEGGLLAKISPIYPNEPINVGQAVHPLPEDHTIPGFDSWQWIHTPGHTPGHVSLFRADDLLLISGDAFITVRQDKFYNVLMQKAEINGPPRYLTTDWDAAYESVNKLAALQSETVIPGHGPMMEGEDLHKGLTKLVKEFHSLAVPDYGRYVDDDRPLH